MKLPDFSPLFAFIRAHIVAFTVSLLAMALLTFAFFGIQHYKYRQSGGYALTRLSAAISQANREELARRVDFNTLTDTLAKSTAQALPFVKQGPDQIRQLKELIQMDLLRLFSDPKAAERGKSEAKQEDPEKMLQQELNLLPPDFLTQLASTLKEQRADGNSILLSASIKHPQLNQTFPLILRMDDGPDGWVIRDLVNAGEVAKQFRDALLTRQTAQHDSKIRKNAATRKRMDSILALQSCTASAGLLSDGKTMVLVAHVLARNTSNVSVNNLNLDATFSGPDGTKLLHRMLNTARPIAPGEDFEHRWSIELDGQSPQAQRILAAGPLACSASWRTLGLSSAEVLHVVDVPDILKKCDKPGHDHPLNFCLSPIFQK